MPPRRPFPAPKKRLHNRAWEIYWYWNKHRYCLQITGIAKEDEVAAEMERLRIAAALASNEPEFPQQYANASGCLKYLMDRTDTDAPAILETPEHWLTSYKKNIEQHCGLEWTRNSMSFLNRLQKNVGGNLAKTTPAQAVAFLDDVQKGNAAATRNRALAACNRFFKWCLATGRARRNPFTGIKQLREARPSEIVYCTRNERERIIKTAKTTRPLDWLAVALAFYAGCRRGEIFRLNWEDVSLKNRKIQVRESKTGEPRTVPIGKALLPLLQKNQKPHGRVVPRTPGETWENQADSIIDELREHLAEPKFPQPDGRPSGPKGRRLFIMSEEEKRATLTAREEATKKGTLRKAFPFDPPARANDKKAWLPGERIGWNAWRHTFGSLLAQDGVSLDKISSWMGNTPNVCRRHYTQFMPRDRHDDEIDLL